MFSSALIDFLQNNEQKLFIKFLIMKSFILSILLILAGSTMAQTISTFPYNEDFEGEGSSTACSGYVMASPGWLNDTGDDNDWVPDAGGTISFGTGPSVDFNPGTFSGKYMYTETSGCNSDTRNLESPWFEFLATSGMEFSFAYHMFGGDMGTLTVEYRTGLVAPWTTLTGPITDNIDSWQTSSTDITFLSGEDSVQFRFVANTGIGFTSDILDCERRNTLDHVLGHSTRHCLLMRLVAGVLLPHQISFSLERTRHIVVPSYQRILHIRMREQKRTYFGVYPCVFPWRVHC